MKTKKNLLLILIIYFSSTTSLFAQISTKHTPFYAPKSVSFNMYSNFHWFINEGIKTNFSDQMYLRANLRYSRKIEFVLINKTKSENNLLHNKFSDVYLSYRNNFKSNHKVPVFRYGSLLNIKLGVIEWYPTYTNVQLILENAEKYINPAQIYGASLVSITPLTKDKSLKIYLSAHTGDLFSKKLDSEITDLYINYTKIFKYHLGVSTQIGIFQGSQHIVNHAQILYMPKLEKMQFDIRVGKLPTYDETPYGIHLGITRKFKYISVGGYYERRLNQDTKGEIAGVQWSILGPPKLAKFVSTFNLFYDFNSNTIWMWVPILKINIDYKQKLKIEP